MPCSWSQTERPLPSTSVPPPLELDAGANLISQGTPTRMNRFLRAHSVQEGASPPGASAANFATASPPVAGLVASFRFTDMPMLAGGYYHFYSEHAQWNFSSLSFQDCQVRGGS